MSVDLPLPFGPISPTRSPSEMAMDRFSKRGRAPYVFEIVSQLSRTAIMGGLAAPG
jgi:hypothetical protein